MAVAMTLLAMPTAALAECDNIAPASGTSVNCTGSITAPARADVGATNVSINIAPGASGSFVNAVNPVAMRVDSGSSVSNGGSLSLSGGATSGSNRGAVLLGRGNGNTLTNATQGVIATTGAFNDAMAANGSNNTLVNQGVIRTAGPNAYGMTAAWGQTNTGQTGNGLINSGSISTTGSNARAMSILGGSGTATNQGSLLTTGTSSFGVYLQGNGDRMTNSGSIETRGAGADAVFSNTAGSSFTATVENQAGGQIVSRQAAAIRTLNGATTVINAGLLQSDAGTAVSMGAGANTLILQTGSTIRGAADGGGNAATQLVLQGSGTADNAFNRFALMQMQGSAWTWSGSGVFNTIDIQSGTVTLASTIGGAAQVRTGATLAGTGTLTGSVTNQGTLHPGNGSGGGQLTIVGDYTGANGVLQTESVLGSDGAPAARLVVSGGAIGGNTLISLANLGGAGGLTTADGIPLVLATNGTTSTATAFALRGGSISAGPYIYYLFHGGASAGSENGWYLRSSLVPTSGAEIAPTAAPGTPELPAPGTPALPSLNLADGGPVVLYRPEVPPYAATPAVVRQIGYDQIGTFHERQGQQALLDERGRLPASWARLWGGRMQQGQQGSVDAAFDGTVAGVQIGQDVYADATASGHRNHYGLMLGFARASGDVNGFAQGFRGATVGTLSVDAYSLGGYWTHVGPTGWYTDAVMQGSTLIANPRSARSVGASTHGTAVSTSIEAGVPLPLGNGFAIEPQAQLIWQHISLNDIDDGISPVSFQTASGWLARVGVRAERQFQRNGVTWMPWLRANLLRSFGGTDQIVFASTDAVDASLASTAAQFGAGVAARLDRSSSLYLTVAYTTNLDGVHRNNLGGNLGLRWLW
ncbi:autotransporter outer membrane beta-barrel domain-containing protein [Cupriavidus pauculus]|uniref:autotransporter family protein n=1 Tax=Cupriavidus pauculus TaxID=82633 RepID=UPI001D0C50A1|nr:autotransporter outer membrane beta-barrel domain-containing protein [Cupriavidus pauculus]